MILAGDIGGTHARLATFDLAAGELVRCDEQIYPTRAYPDLESVVREFLGKHRAALEAACFGVAGPVIDDSVHMSNTGWTIAAASIARVAGVKRVMLINDLVANAYGATVLKAEDFQTLNEGVCAPNGNGAVISAGTGLGEAGLYFDGRAYRPFATEGGHADFAPTDDLQVELLRFLRGQFKRVSVERVLSGGGLLNIYRFLRETGRGGEQPAWLAEEIRTGDPPAVITQAAMDGKSALCEAALDLFVAIYGAEAGNLALKMLARGGLFIGGGIAVKIAPRLAQPRFLDAFFAKGRMTRVMREIPVRLILNDSAALIGAAHAASLAIAAAAS